MFDLSQFLLHAGFLCGLVTIFLLAMVFYNPRLMLQDYPSAIQALVPPKTGKEKRLTILLGLPLIFLLSVYPVYATFAFQAGAGGRAGFLHLFLYAFGFSLVFNLWDWLVLDWLIFCTLTPRRFVLPGTEGNPAYKDYAFHFRGFLKGIGFSLLMGLIAAGIVALFGVG
jgi:hypothetical protein